MPNLTLEAKALRAQRQARDHAQHQDAILISDPRRQSKEHSRWLVDQMVARSGVPVKRGRAKRRTLLRDSDAGRLMRQAQEDNVKAPTAQPKKIVQFSEWELVYWTGFGWKPTTYVGKDYLKCACEMDRRHYQGDTTTYLVKGLR
jgi:hypothetical protein